MEKIKAGEAVPGMPMKRMFFSNEPIDLDKIEDELLALDARLERFDLTDDESDIDDENHIKEEDNRRKRFTGTCVVVLKTDADLYKVLDHQEKGIYVYLRKLVSYYFNSRSLNHPQYWNWQRAPEPKDIYWENFAGTAKSYYLHEAIGMCLSLVFIWVSFGVIAICKRYITREIDHELSELGDIDPSLRDTNEHAEHLA